MQRSLVVEGWVPDYNLAEIRGEFDRGRYKRILATGLPLEHGSFLSPYKAYADLRPLKNGFAAAQNLFR